MAVSHPTQLHPELRPGERMVAGRPHVFSLELLNAHLSDRAIAEAPEDLTTLSAAELAELLAAYLNRRFRYPHDEANEAFGRRVCAEYDSRPERAAYRGGRH